MSIYKWRTNAPLAPERLGRCLSRLRTLDDMLSAHEESADLVVREMTVYIEGVEWYTEPTGDRDFGRLRTVLTGDPS